MILDNSTNLCQTRNHRNADNKPAALAVGLQRIKIKVEMSVCPYCKDRVEDNEAWFCPTCDAAHHVECRESNHGMCAVYGCKSRPEEGLLGCPICEQAFSSDHATCIECGQPLMTAEQIAEFLDRYEWKPLPTDNDWNPALTAGYLRNSGIVARLSKNVPVSMLRFDAKVTVWIPAEQVEEARKLLKSLAERFQPCPDCGHTLFIDEEDCSYCTESSGAQA